MVEGIFTDGPSFRQFISYGQVIKNQRSRCVEKVPKCWIFKEFAYFWAFLTGVLAGLTVRGVEIEPHIMLL